MLSLLSCSGHVRIFCSLRFVLPGLCMIKTRPFLSLHEVAAHQKVWKLSNPANLLNISESGEKPATKATTRMMFGKASGV